MFNKIRNHYVQTGIVNTARWVFMSIFYYPLVNRIADRFDRKYGTDTTSGLKLNEYDSNPNVVANAVGYAPTPDAVFIRLLKKFSLKKSSSTFIDLGCGKGRTLMLASQLPFKAIIGVEFETKLCEICKKNLEIFVKACKKISCLLTVECRDAGNFNFPEGDILLYLFNPFNELIMNKVADRIKQALNSSQRQIRIIYFHPNQLESLMQIPGVQIIYDEQFRDRMSANGVSRVVVLDVLSQ